MDISYLELGKKWLEESKDIRYGVMWWNPWIYYQFYSNYSTVPCEWDYNEKEKYFSIRPSPMRRTAAWRKWKFEKYLIEIRLYRNEIQLLVGEVQTSTYKKDGPQNKLFKLMDKKFSK